MNYIRLRFCSLYTSEFPKIKGVFYLKIPGVKTCFSAEGGREDPVQYLTEVAGEGGTNCPPQKFLSSQKFRPLKETTIKEMSIYWSQARLEFIFLLLQDMKFET